jgi:hypothetical protein
MDVSRSCPQGKYPKILPRVLPAAGVVVSTVPGRGHFCTVDFDSDDQAVQYAYDRMIDDPALPRTLLLDTPDRPFAFAGPLTVWQSHCRVTSTGGVTLTPADGYNGPLITSALRDATERGEDGLICNIVIDHLWLNGRNQSLGIKLKHLQLSTIHDLHIRNTNGPGLWLSDYCIENLFSNLILSDECGSVDQPALLLEPESSDLIPGIPNLGNITINSTRFAGTMIHFPTNAALRISTGPAQVEATRRHRKIQFSGCYFHAHERQTAPLVTIAEGYELAFVGTQMLAWQDKGAVFQMGLPDAPLPAGNTLISHCIFASKPGSDCVGIRTTNVDTESPCLAVFGNSFGSHQRPLAHAVDWGSQPGKSAAWAGNTVHTTGAPHVGVFPADADTSPFHL